MIKIIEVDGILEVEGEINLGYIGVYNGQKIKLKDNTIEKYKKSGIVRDNVSPDATDEEIVNYLNHYYNELLEKIDKNIKIINNKFLLMIFEEMYSIGLEFWNNREFIVEEEFSKVNNLELIYDKYSSVNFNKEEDVEKNLKEIFPFFNFDNFVNLINPEYAYLTKYGQISFQCSDKYNFILCGAYDVIDSNLEFNDWHNF